MERRIRSFSCAGSYHVSAEQENQDAVFSGSSRRYEVISLADGVSECGEAKAGARIAGQAVADLFLRKGDHFLGFEDRMIAELAVSHVVYELKIQACRDQRNVKDYSSTVAAVLYDKKKKKLLLLNLGDSMILASGGRCRVLAMPRDSRSGCCVTTTEGASRMTQVQVIDAADLDSVVICSDGAWKQMYAGNHLKENVSEMLINGEYDGLKDFLEKQGSMDDRSFISMDLKDNIRRKSA